MLNHNFLRPAFLEIDLDALAFNCRNIKKKLGKNVELLAVVKADGYGHGAYLSSKTFLQNGASSLGVAIIEEGIELREKKIQAPILVVYPEDNGREKLIVDYNLEQVICSYEAALALNRMAQKKNKKVNIYLEVDTGLGRYGLTPEETIKLAAKVQNLKHLTLKGIISHFSMSDSKNTAFTKTQLQLFKRTVANLEKRKINFPIQSMANSAAVLNLPESYFNQVRVGHLLYGLYPSVSRSVSVRPAMRLQSKIAFIKEVSKNFPVSYGATYYTSKSSRIGTVPLGYADGYSWLLSNKALVLVKNKKVPVIGRICMDAFMIDLTTVPEAKVGDEIVLIGKQGKQEITIYDVSQWIGTSTYEVINRMGKRLPVVYLQNSKRILLNAKA